MVEMILHWLEVAFVNAILSFSTSPCVSVTLKDPQLFRMSKNPGPLRLPIKSTLSTPKEPLFRYSQIRWPARYVGGALLTRTGSECLGAYVCNSSIDFHCSDEPVHSQFIISTTNDVILREKLHM